MPRRINILLLVLITIGVILTIGQTRLNRALQARHDTLAHQFGDFPIDDPAKVYVLALKSDSPLHFRWRVYLPPNYDADWRGAGGLSRNRSSSARDFITEIRIRKLDDDRMHVYMTQDMGRTVFAVGNQEFAEFLRDRWDEIEYTQLGTNGLLEFEVDDVVTLLEARMSPKLAEDAEALFGQERQQQYIPLLFHRQLGTAEGFARAGAATK